MLRTWIFFLSLVTAVNANAQAPGSLCWNTSVPVSLGHDVGIQADTFKFGATVESSGFVASFINKTGRVITGASFFAELIDETGTPIISTAFSSGASDSKWPFATNHTPMPSPWLTGDRVSISVFLQRATAHCPLKALVYVRQLVFSDGSSALFSAGNREAQCAIRSIPPLQVIGAKLQDRQVVVRLTVGNNGQVTSVEAQDASTQAWLESQLSRWKFFPRLKEGVPISDNVQLLIRIHTTNDRSHLDRYDKSVFERFPSLIPVDIFIESWDKPPHQTVFVGGQPFDLQAPDAGSE